jgi:hypothetical protein
MSKPSKPETGNESEAASTQRNGREEIRIGLEADAIADALIDNLHYLQAKLPQHATRNDWYMALAYTVRDRMLHRYIKTVETTTAANTSAKVLAYLSAEFLTGPHLGNSLINLGIWQLRRKRCRESGKIYPTFSIRKKSPAWAMAGSAVWPRAIWTRWRQSRPLLFGPLHPGVLPSYLERQPDDDKRTMKLNANV